MKFVQEKMQEEENERKGRSNESDGSREKLIT